MRRWQNADDPVALASYNAGPDAVRRYGGTPPYAQTVAYVCYVTRLYRKLGREAPMTAARQVGVPSFPALTWRGPSRGALRSTMKVMVWVAPPCRLH